MKSQINKLIRDLRQTKHDLVFVRYAISQEGVLQFVDKVIERLEKIAEPEFPNYCEKCQQSIDCVPGKLTCECTVRDMYPANEYPDYWDKIRREP